MVFNKNHSTSSHTRKSLHQISTAWFTVLLGTSIRGGRSNIMGWAAQFSLPTVQIITMVLPIKITIRHPTHVITPLISTAWVTVLFGINTRRGTDVLRHLH